MRTKPGWAVPAGSVGGLSHWWRPDSKPACDPKGPTGYSGPTSPSVETHKACPFCLLAVLDAGAVLGTPGAAREASLPPDRHPDEEADMLAEYAGEAYAFDEDLGRRINRSATIMRDRQWRLERLAGGVPR